MARLRFTKAGRRRRRGGRPSSFPRGRPCRCSAPRRLPDAAVPQSQNSKHPVAWVTVFAFDPPDGALMDGGKFFVSVDLESGAVTVRG